MNTEFHAFVDNQKNEVIFFLRSDRWFEGLNIPLRLLIDDRQKAHEIIMVGLAKLCAAWKDKTKEDYYPIPAGTGYHEYDLVQASVPTTRRTIWKFDR